MTNAIDKDINSPSSSTRFPSVLCSVFLILAALLRFVGLGAEALFLDEYFTLETISVPGFGAFIRWIWEHDPHPPLYFILLKGWVAVFGDSPFSLRAPSALFGIATVWAMMRALYETRLTSPFSLFLIGLFATVSPFLVYYSQEARSYSMMVFFYTLNWVFLIRIWRNNGALLPRRDLLGLVLTALFSVLTHYFSIFLAALDLGILLLWMASGEGATWRNPLSWKNRFSPRALFAITLLGAFCLAVCVIGMRVGDKTELISWLPEWEPAFLYYQWRAMVDGPLHVVSPHWLVVAAFLAWAGALAAAGLPRKGDSRRAFLLPLGLGVVVTFLLPHLLSSFHPLLFFGQRYMIVSLPVFLLILSLSMTWSHRPRLQSALLFLILIPAVLYYINYYQHRQKRAWDTVAEECGQRLGPNGVVWYVASGGKGPLLYYARREGLQVITKSDPTTFPPPEASVERLAVVSINENIAQMPPPEGFAYPSTGAVYTSRDGTEVYIRTFQRE